MSDEQRRLRQFPLGAGSLSAALSRARQSIIGVSQLLYVPSCACCFRPVQGPRRLCRTCESQLKLVLDSRCQRCAMPLPNRNSHCPHCRVTQFWFDRVLTLGSYKELRRDVATRMKSRSEQPLIWAAASLLVEALNDQGETYDLVTSVPTHWRRRWSRGFWPAGLLGQRVASGLGLPFRPRLARINRSTKKQGVLLPNQRRANVRGAFSISKRIDLSSKRVLLVDDIMTTGATVNELSRILKKSGAERISVAVFARGTGGR